MLGRDEVKASLEHVRGKMDVLHDSLKAGIRQEGTHRGKTRSPRGHVTQTGDPFNDLHSSVLKDVEDEDKQSEEVDRVDHEEINTFLSLYGLKREEKGPWWSGMPYWMRDAMKNWLPPEALKRDGEAGGGQSLSRDELDRQTEGSFSMAWGVFKQLCIFIAHSHVFTLLVLFVIILNMIFMGFQVDSGWDQGTENSVDSVFIAFFLLEAIIRVTAHSSFQNQHKQLLFFEVSIVVISVIDKWIIPFLMATHHEVDLSVLTAFRAARLLQSIRMVQVLHYLRPVRIMETAVSRAVSYFFWNFLYMISLSYMFSLAFRIALKQAEDPRLNYGMEYNYVGSTWISVIFLAEAVVGGLQWNDQLYGPLMQDDDTKLPGILLVIFIFGFSVAVMIMMKASFIENFMSSGVQENTIIFRDILMYRLDIAGLTEVLNHCDEKGDGRITLFEFLSPLHDPTRRGYKRKFLKIFGLQRLPLEDKELHIERCERLLKAMFHCMDIGGEGSVAIDIVLWCYIKLMGSKNDVDDVVKEYSFKMLLRLLQSPEKDFRLLGERIDRIRDCIILHQEKTKVTLTEIEESLKPLTASLARLEDRFADVSGSLAEFDPRKVKDESALAPGAAGVASLRLRAEMDALKKAALELLVEEQPPAPWFEEQGEELMI